MSNKKIENNDSQKAFDQLKNNVIQLNNNYISKRNVQIGSNFKVTLIRIIKPELNRYVNMNTFFHFKVLPYLIDKDLNRKKKQPKVVRAGKVGVDTTSDFFLNNYYRELCGTGGPLFFPRSPVDHALNCRMIHHNNPYLSKKIFHFLYQLLLLVSN